MYRPSLGHSESICELSQIHGIVVEKHQQHRVVRYIKKYGFGVWMSSVSKQMRELRVSGLHTGGDRRPYRRRDPGKLSHHPYVSVPTTLCT